MWIKSMNSTNNLEFAKNSQELPTNSQEFPQNNLEFPSKNPEFPKKLELNEQIKAKLSRLKKPPKELFFVGDTALLSRPIVAIVGSRKCSKYTQNLILSLSATLKKHGIVVISGGAIGADIFAHEGALPRTIGVFANSLDMIYPAQNERIIKQIYEQGLAISEFESGHAPRSYDFLARNRIVAGLSDAVVIAQADIKSGSMSSANYAKSAEIPLFGLPQRKGESDGTNMLICKGDMKLLDDFESFALSFGGELFMSLSEQKSKKDDEILEFLSANNDFNAAYARFGDKLFEYEIEGLVAIDGAFVRVL